MEASGELGVAFAPVFRFCVIPIISFSKSPLPVPAIMTSLAVVGDQPFYSIYGLRPSLISTSREYGRLRRRLLRAVYIMRLAGCIAWVRFPERRQLIALDLLLR